MTQIPASKVLSTMFVQEANAEEQSQLIHLIKLSIKNEAPLYFVTADHNVKFGGREYIAFPIAFKEFSQTLDGTISKAEITMANVSREIMYYIEQYDGLRGSTVDIKTVFSKFLDFKYTFDADGSLIENYNSDADPLSYVEENFVIDAYSATEEVATFQLDAVVDMTVMLPRRRFTTNSCYWCYKGAECASISTLPTCGKTFSDCIIRGNATRFGGFPGVPRKARRLFF